MPNKPSRGEDRLRLQRFTGGRIRQAREEHGLTQRELAMKMGFTHTWLSNIETGSNGIDAHDLRAIADELGYPLEWFTDPDYDPQVFRRPRSKMEWDIAYQGMPDLARLHWELDSAVTRIQRQHDS